MLIELPKTIGSARPQAEQLRLNLSVWISSCPKLSVPSLLNYRLRECFHKFARFRGLAMSRLRSDSTTTQSDCCQYSKAGNDNCPRSPGGNRPCSWPSFSPASTTFWVVDAADVAPSNWVLQVLSHHCQNRQQCWD